MAAGVLATVLLWLVVGYAYVRFRSVEVSGGLWWTGGAFVSGLVVIGEEIADGTWTVVPFLAPLVLLSGYLAYRSLSARRQPT